MIVYSNNTVPQTNPLYLNGRNIQKFNLLKYKVLYAILDYIATMNGTILPGAAHPEVFEEQNIFDILLHNGIIKRGKEQALITIE